MPTTVTVNFPASGTLTARAYYLSPESGSLYSYRNFMKISQTDSITKVSSNTLSLPAGCLVTKAIPSTNLPAGYQIYIGNGGVAYSKINQTAICEYLTSLASNAAYSSTISIVYKYNGSPWTSVIYIDGSDGQDQTLAGRAYTHTGSIQASTLTITYYTATEISQGAVIAEDPLPDEADGTPFIIEKYGSTRKHYGVAIGGIPISEDEEEPSFDCYIPTVFTGAINIDSDAMISQAPIWRDFSISDYGSGWTDSSKYSDMPPQYCRVNGCVYVRGFVYRAGKSYTNGSTILTLPEGYRPPAAVTKLCVFEPKAFTDSGTLCRGYAKITINTNGTIVATLIGQLHGGSTIGSDYCSDNAWVNLNFGFRL